MGSKHRVKKTCLLYSLVVVNRNRWSTESSHIALWELGLCIVHRLWLPGEISSGQRKGRTQSPFWKLQLAHRAIVFILSLILVRIYKFIYLRRFHNKPSVGSCGIKAISYYSLETVTVKPKLTELTRPLFICSYYTLAFNSSNKIIRQFCDSVG